MVLLLQTDSADNPAQDVEEEEGLAVADPRESRSEAPGRTAFVLSLYRGLVALPVLSVGRIGDQAVEMAPAWRSLESVLPKAIFLASRPVGSFMKKSDLERAQVSGFTS